MDRRSLGMACKEYGGTWTDIGTLAVGEVFFVHNGNWYGKITEDRKGRKTLEVYEWLWDKANNKGMKPKFVYYLDEFDTANNLLAISMFM